MLLLQFSFGRCPDFSWVADDADTGRFERLHFFGGGSFATRDDRARMAHAAAWRCGDPGNEADDRFLHVLFNELGCFLFRIAADLTDHDDRLSFRVLFKERQHIDKPGPVHRIAAYADTGRFTKPKRRQLVNRLIRQGATAGYHAHHTLFMDETWHDPDLGLIDRDDPWAVGTNQTNITSTERPLHFHHVVDRDAFGDTND